MNARSTCTWSMNTCRQGRALTECLLSVSGRNWVANICISWEHATRSYTLIQKLGCLYMYLSYPLKKGIHNVILHKLYFCLLVLDFHLCFIFCIIPSFYKYVGHHGKRKPSNVNSFTCITLYVKSDTGLKKIGSLFSVKCLDIIIFIPILNMWEKGTEKYFMMALLKYDIQIYWQEAVLISSLPFLYMPLLASFLLVYLIQSFHPIYKAFPNLSYIVLALIFSLSTMISIAWYFFSCSLALVSLAFHKHLYY